MNQRDRFILADALGESPQTCIAVHALRSGRCRVAISGQPDEFDAIVVDPSCSPGELLAFGSNPAEIWKVVRSMKNWSCIEVLDNLAGPLSAHIEQESQQSVSHFNDLFFIGQSPAPQLTHTSVRLLSRDDIKLYAASAAMFRDNPEDLKRNLIEGPVAAAICDGKVVSAVEANIRTSQFANLTAETLTAYRNRGLSTACASLAVFAVKKMGLIPVWSCGETNHASLRVAEKLGFVPAKRMIYLALVRRPPELVSGDQ